MIQAIKHQGRRGISLLFLDEFDERNISYMSLIRYCTDPRGIEPWQCKIVKLIKEIGNHHETNLATQRTSMNDNGIGEYSRLGGHPFSNTSATYLLRIDERACQSPKEWNLKSIQRVGCEFISELVTLIRGSCEKYRLDRHEKTANRSVQDPGQI